MLKRSDVFRLVASKLTERGFKSVFGPHMFRGDGIDGFERCLRISYSGRGQTTELCPHYGITHPDFRLLASELSGKASPQSQVIYEIAYYFFPRDFSGPYSWSIDKSSELEAIRSMAPMLDHLEQYGVPFIDASSNWDALLELTSDPKNYSGEISHPVLLHLEGRTAEAVSWGKRQAAYGVDEDFTSLVERLQLLLQAKLEW